MRIAVMVIGLILGAIMFVQTFLVYALSGAAQDEASGAAGSVGVLMALLWLIACGLVLPVPFVSAVLFLIAGGIGFGFAGDFPDLAWWGVVSLVLTVLAFLGWVGKRRGERHARIRQEVESRERQEGIDRAVAAGIAAASARPSDG